MFKMSWDLVKRFRRKSHAALPLRGGEGDYELRVSKEQSQFDDCLNVHDLPDIFHYWSNKYLVPMLAPCGFTNPWDFFFKFALEKCGEKPDRCCSIVSIGAGNCDVEIELAERLIEHGVDNFRIDCIEINGNMLERARLRADDSPAAGKVNLLPQDFNRWQPAHGIYDVVMANQSLHHVLELEHLFDAIRLGLAEGGLFRTSDMIGRNGHQRWPEALEVVNAFWRELPEAYRYNRLMQRQEQEFINHDCSTSGFEGIRAQEILPLLLERFRFRVFLPYGNAIFAFIDRPFGHNFDAAAEWDRDFVDRVHAADEEGFLDGRLKPTSMLAVMALEETDTELRHPRLTPEFCVRLAND